MATATQELTSDSQRAVEPYYEQRPFMGLDKRFYGFVSGTGAGKTFAGAYRLWVNSEWWNPNSMGAIIVPDKSQFVDNIKPILDDFGLVGDNGTWEYQSVYSDEPGLHTHNDQRILILSADNQRQIGRIKGKNLGYVWMDEEAEIDPRAREIAQQRLRVGDYPNLFITTTPDGYNHTYDFFEGDVETQKYRHGDAMIYEAEDRMAVVGVPPEANPEIRDEDIANMRSSLPDAIVQQEIEGEFVQIGRGVLQRDMLTPVSSDVLDSTELSFHVGVDLGIEPDAQRAERNDTDYFAAAIVGHHRRHGEAFVVDVARKRGLSLSQGVEWLREVVSGVPEPTINVESVHAQQYFLTAAKDAGLPVQGVEQSLKKEDRLIQLSVPFENDTIQLVNFNHPPEDGLDSRWDQLIQEWIAFPDGTHDDMLDAVELALRGLSIGQSFGIDAMDLYGRDH